MIVIVDLPVAVGAFKPEPAQVVLAIRVDGVVKAIEVANLSEQFRPLAEVSVKSDVADQICDPAGHHDTVVARDGEMLAQPVVEAGDLRCATLGVV